MKKETKVAESRNYAVKDVRSAKSIAKELLKEYELEKTISFGLPEIDDRFHIWRVPLLNASNGKKLGEVVIDAKSSLIDSKKTTRKDILEGRLLQRKKIIIKQKKTKDYKISKLRNTVGLGDSESLISELPAESVDLIFTSPPYYNAKPEYSEYIDYEDYLYKMRKIIRASARVLSDGRFFVLNVSPVLLRRKNRNSSSTRIAVPFDFHRIFIEEGFEFIDDIIWKKPSGAGWATGRGRRFAADRNALQYKAVPVTEYVLVYRKKTDKLIDWYLKNHPDREVVEKSRIKNYEPTNVWEISPAYSKKHPAIFPLELAERVITHYSFVNDVVLDPFAGIGTTALAAIKNQRRFVMFEMDEEYIKEIKRVVGKSLLGDSENVVCINTSKIKLLNPTLL